MRLFLVAVALLSPMAFSRDINVNYGIYRPHYFESLGNRVVKQALADLRAVSSDDIKTHGIILGVSRANIAVDQRMAILRSFIEATLQTEGWISRKRVVSLRIAVSVLARDGSPGVAAYFRGWMIPPGIIDSVRCTSDSRTEEQIGVEALDALIVALAQSPSADARKLFYEIRARPPDFIKKRSELMRDLHYDYGDYNSGLAEPAR